MTISAGPAGRSGTKMASERSLMEQKLHEAEALTLWPTDVKSWLIGKDPDAGKNWRQEKKGITGWNGCMALLTQWTQFEQAPGDGEGQGSLVYWSPWGAKMRTQLSNWTTWSRNGQSWYPHWAQSFLGAVWEESGLSLNIIMNPEGTSTGSCAFWQVNTALSRRESKWGTSMATTVHSLCHEDSLLPTYWVSVPWTSPPQEKLPQGRLVQ